MQQSVQTDATCNTQQYWELLANIVASVSRQSWPFGLNNHCNITHQKLSGKSVNEPISCLQIFKLIFVKLHGSENVGCNLLNFSEIGNYAKPFFWYLVLLSCLINLIIKGFWIYFFYLWKDGISPPIVTQYKRNQEITLDMTENLSVGVLITFCPLTCPCTKALCSNNSFFCFRERVGFCLNKQKECVISRTAFCKSVHNGFAEL